MKKLSSEQLRIVSLLKEKGYSYLNSPRKIFEFTFIKKADELLNDIENHPHHFVLGCSVDRQTTAERAWSITYKIGLLIGGFEFSRYRKLSLKDCRKLFIKNKLHRFNNLISHSFYNAVRRIDKQYKGNPSSIWSGNPKSRDVVNRFLEFDGIGIKISTMAANILYRDFKVPLLDASAIDISPDVHICRVFYRLGFTRNPKDVKGTVETARNLNPSYPGVFDYHCWEIGRNFCHSSNAECSSCYLKDFCPSAGKY